MGVAVWQYMRAIDSVDDAGVSSGITRQAGVAGRIDLFRPYGLADCKTRQRIHRTLEPAALGDRRCDLLGRQRRCRLRGPRRRLAALELGGSDEATLFKPRDQPDEPFLVIAHTEIIGGPDTLD